MNKAKKQMRNILYSLISLWGVLAGCSSFPGSLTISVEQRQEFDSIPSGSGMAIYGDTAWIIGDDATGIYHVSLTSLQYKKVRFEEYEPTLYRIPKPIKPDYEAVVTGVINGRDQMLVFGSGSISPYRDSLLLVDPRTGSVEQKISMGAFYKQLKLSAGKPNLTLNLEAAVIVGKNLYLFHRGQNLMFRVVWNEFAGHLMQPDSKQLLEIKSFEITLPKMNGLQAGFSGACTWSEDQILFAASVENTANAIDDGPVLGSFIGIINISGNKHKLGAAIFLKDSASKTLKDKIESVAIAGNNSDGSKKVMAIADNDNGRTILLELRVKD